MSKIVVVTGGNRGIGLEICRRLAELGLVVVLGSRNLDKGIEAAEKIRGKVIPVKLDVTSNYDISALFNKVHDEFGYLDVLINNAGIISPSNVTDVSAEEVGEVFNNNVFAPWQLVQAFLPLLVKSSDARIINMSSGMGSGTDQYPDHAAYRLSKFTLNGLTMQLAHELADMKVNAMCPGWVKTDMGGSSAPRSVQQGADTAVWLTTAENIPSGKFFRDRKEIPW